MQEVWSGFFGGIGGWVGRGEISFVSIVGIMGIGGGVPTKLKPNSVALVRERTIPTERPPPVGEVSANFCG